MTDLLRLASTNPAQAHRLALNLRDTSDLGLRLAALRVLALTGDHLQQSLAHLQEAEFSATQAGLSYEVAQIQSTRVALLTARGQVVSALADAEQAARLLQGHDVVRLASNRICALARSGRIVEARAAAMQALSQAAPAAPPGLLINAGLALATCAEFEAAEACLSEAERRAEREGLAHEAFMARANLAFAAARQGRLAAALSTFNELEAAADHPSRDRAQVRLDHADALTMLGRPGQARELAASALSELTNGGFAGDVADGLLILARAQLADGDPEGAAETAETARTAFGDQRRPGWALLADHLLLKARWAVGERSSVFLRSAVASADRLASNGWRSEAADGRIVAAELAMGLDRPTGDLLEEIAAVRHEGPAVLRAEAWRTTALGRQRSGDRRGALAAVRAGLRVVSEELPEPAELRVEAMRWGSGLSEYGLRLARSARGLLAAEERRRALVWRSGADLAALPDLLAEDDRGLVEFVRVGDDLHAVTVAAGRHHRTNLGRYAPIAREARLTTAAVRRTTRQTNPEMSASVGHRLEALTLAPLLPRLGDRPLVIAPTDTLHSVPWTAFPALSHRPLSVVPSAAIWIKARSRPPRPQGHTLLAAGPDLLHAESEIQTLAGIHPKAMVLTGHAATPDAVRRALDGAALVHLAAHGTHHRDHPLDSALHLAGGPLKVTALDALQRPPTTVILSACDVAQTADPEAVLGLAAAFLTQGSRSVIASVTPVSDEAARRLMPAFHRRLAAGHPPAQALTDPGLPRSPGDLGFQCYGAG